MINTIKQEQINYTKNILFSAHKNNRKQNKNIDYSTASIICASAIGISAISFLTYKNFNNRYKTQLAKDLSKELGEKITTKHLESIMTPKEMINQLSKLTEGNYIASHDNIKNGIFLADLHSHSKYSDGNISVEALLNQAAKYGDRLNQINGKKFIFALSDHDGIEGVREALKIIVKNPKKYKNIKFVPAAELSFILPSQRNSEKFKRCGSEVEMPEMLIYNINPFSKFSTKFFEKKYNLRAKQIENAINEANTLTNSKNFSVEEYNQFYALPGRQLCLLNQHWKVWNYLHTKSRVIEMAKEQNVNPKEFYAQIFNNKKDATPDDLLRYIQDQNIPTNSKKIDDKLAEMLKTKYFPQKINDSVATSEYETDFNDIVQYAKNENAYLGFAHPGFTMQNFNDENMLSFMQNLVQKGKDRIKFSETHHQAYPIGTNISEAELAKYNKILKQLQLIHIGGRDNHSTKFIPD